MFHWDAPQEKRFDDLHRSLTTAPVLHFPKYENLLRCIQTRLSGLGAVFMQLDSSGELRVIAYVSRSLKHEEGNYSVTHLESLL